MKKIAVLGAGIVGKAIAIDLSEKHEVTSFDNDPEALQLLENKDNINIQEADLSGRLDQWLDGFDLVMGAVPGFMGFETVKKVIDCGIDMVDISFFPEDALELDESARQAGVTVVTDCGLAPGMDNIILGYFNQKMEVDMFECLVGGLPVIREWPFEYKAVFSPVDVIEEYIRPARYVENGHVVTKEALSDPELVEFREVGTLEAWNSDGLRTLIRTMDIPNMIEKTLRYPGTIEYLKVLRESGFFSRDPVEVNGHKIRPIDLTSKLLFPKWKLNPGEEDLTVMRVRVAGEGSGQGKAYEYYLYNRYDRKSKMTSMSRCTGFTATAVAELVLEGKFDRKGICPPEYLGGKPENFDHIIRYLSERGIDYQSREIAPEKV